MSKLIPLKIPFGRYIFGNDSYTANEPPKEYQEIEALPTLKAKLEYFNNNIKSLAHSSEQATDLSRWKEPLSVMHRQPCKCGKHTPADFELFQEMRAKELKRLTDELNQLETYGEKVAYLITQPGFSINRLIADEDFDLSPRKRPPADIKAFNELSKRHFEQSYFPNHYRGALFSREKETIIARLAKADDPVYQVELYRQEIEAYTGYKKPKKPAADTSGLNETQRQSLHLQQLFNEVGTENSSSNRRAKATFLKCAAGMDAAPNLCAEPLYDEEWEAIEHGQQLYQLYQWLGLWQPGQMGNVVKQKTPAAIPVKYKAKYYAFYHLILIELGLKQPFELNRNGNLCREELEAYAANHYPGCSKQGFYRDYKDFCTAKKIAIAERLGKGYKEVVIEISNNDSRVISHLKKYPN